jgi:hypothetical protein
LIAADLPMSTAIAFMDSFSSGISFPQHGCSVDRRHQSALRLRFSVAVNTDCAGIFASRY